MVHKLKGKDVLAWIWIRNRESRISISWLGLHPNLILGIFHARLGLNKLKIEII